MLKQTFVKGELAEVGKVIEASEEDTNLLIGNGHAIAVSESAKKPEHKEKYIQEVILSDLSKPGDEDVFIKVKSDLAKAGIENIDDEIRNKMKELMERAKKDFS